MVDAGGRGDRSYGPLPRRDIWQRGGRWLGRHELQIMWSAFLLDTGEEIMGANQILAGLERVN